MTAATAPIVRICEEDQPTWREACWVGVMADDLVAEIGAIRLDGAEQYSRARFLVRRDGVIRGFVEVDVRNGYADVRTLRRLIAELDEPATLSSPRIWPTVTVVICERNPGNRTARALQAVMGIDYPSFEVLVIGWSAHTAAGLRIVDEYGAGRALWLDGMDDGIGRARNRGMHVADGSVLAYIDSGVAVDQNWLRFLLTGFDLATDVAAVSGMTIPGQLSTKCDTIADALEPLPTRLEAEVLRTHGAEDSSAAARLHAGIDGVCRNFAIHRDVALSAGGWVATPSRRAPVTGGEDIALLLRILHRGSAVGHEPSAVAFSFP